jgi:membrane-associated phospholipid phosphatase
MSVTGGLKQPVAAPATPPPWPRWVRANVLQWCALIGRPARGTGAATLAWRAPLRLAIGAVILAALIGGTMIAFDAWAIREMVQRFPVWLTPAVEEYTEFGKSSWFLVPTGVALLGLAALASPTLPRMSRLVLAALSVRIGFVFLALAVPGVVVAVVKRLIGRARPLVGGSDDPFTYLPFGWDVEYASLPSGHASTAFAAAVAIGALWPRLRPLLWTYAVLIAVSRVVLIAHHPSDVLAGAVFGVVGALLVRDWFAARRLAFAPGAEGRIRVLPGPSFARIKRVARQLFAP